MFHAILMFMVMSVLHHRTNQTLDRFKYYKPEKIKGMLCAPKTGNNWNPVGIDHYNFVFIPSPQTTLKKSLHDNFTDLFVQFPVGEFEDQSCELVLRWVEWLLHQPVPQQGQIISGGSPQVHRQTSEQMLRHLNTDKTRSELGMSRGGTWWSSDEPTALYHHKYQWFQVWKWLAERAMHHNFSGFN